MPQDRQAEIDREGSPTGHDEDEPHVDQPTLFDPDPEVASSEEDGSFLDRVLAFEREPSPVFLAAILAGSVLMLAAATLGLFPWIGSALGVAGLLATMFRGGRWVTLVCGLAVVGVVLADSWPREPTPADVGSGDATAQTQTDPGTEAPAGSLGFRLSELPDLWNALDRPPMITRGFSRSLERGALDGFVTRFDEGASLAGAYDPADDYVYALSASTRLDHEAVTTMYLHMCFALHPYSQECIDAYWDEGLNGRSPIDYLGTEHTAEWQMGEETWRLAIVGNVQEIKILGEPPG